MLAAGLLHVTALTRPSLRRRGLVGDAVALWSRASRRKRAWAPHEERSRAVVSRAVEAAPGRGAVAVLGSGLIRDVPLDLLAARFDRVWLVDAVHLLPARLRARRAGAVPVVADLSDGGEGAPDPALARLGPVDLVVSANLLSQLILGRIRELAEDEEEGVARDATVRAHLAALRGFGCPVCLVSDVSYRDVAPDGTILDDVTMVPNAGLPAPEEEWDWTVAPRGEISRRFARVHRVGVWRLGPGDTGPGCL